MKRYISMIILLTVFLLAACTTEKEPEGSQISQTQQATTEPTAAPSAQELLAQIKKGMTKEEVDAILGPSGNDIGCSSICYEYIISEDELIEVHYVTDSDGVVRVMGAVVRERPNFKEMVSQVKIGMSIYEVYEILGGPHEDVSNDPFTVRYTYEDGTELTIVYTLDEDRTLRVARLE
ncbi:MAG: hypothetical protein IJV82_01575 [Oscillospiraceae bacterium]|nr:hypothetical protein [Oscillospiraceae bacterium]